LNKRMPGGPNGKKRRADVIGAIADEYRSSLKRSVA
jgi:hypothetical protein